MGNIPSHMRYQGDWRLGARRRRSNMAPWVMIGALVGIAVGLLEVGKPLL
jgi:hypothetical protein